jgi:hypothetical protein
MVDQCANPHCCKPLHYLNEGRIYVFETRDRSTRSSTEEAACRREHFWLCGSCSPSMSLEKTLESAVRLVPRGSRCASRDQGGLRYGPNSSLGEVQPKRRRQAALPDSLCFG